VARWLFPGTGREDDGVIASGRLLVAATPIGDPGDASERLKAALTDVPIIAAEDTRRLQRLTSALGVRYQGRVVSFFEANEQARVDELIHELRSGHDVLLVSDAGMPGVSDPGFRLVREAIARGIAVSVLPGPSAVLTALVLSGLPVDRFAFDGFPPRTAAARRTWLERLRREERTVVFFEAPHRLAACLADAVDVLGGHRPAAICRELTKTYEEVIRGGLAELSEWAKSHEVLGEITVVVGADSEPEIDDAALVDEVLRREGAGMPRKEAIAEVASSHGVPKRRVFDAVVSQKHRD
jgi:16S rRNA (cytidine1402-2'-O)-methyltransferase